MARCANCGVEVEPSLSRCPLCRSPMVPDACHAEPGGAAQPPGVAAATPGPVPQPKRSGLRRFLAEAVTLLAAAGAIVVFAADFAYRMTLTWSLYPLAAIGFLWLSALAAIAAWQRPVLWLPLQVALLLLFLYALDLLTPGRSWFLALGLPGTVLAVLLAVAAVAVAKRAGGAPLPAVAIALLAAGLYLLGLEHLLGRFASRRLYPGWSLVAFGCILPLVMVLLALHRWLRRRPEVRRLFHL